MSGFDTGLHLKLGCRGECLETWSSYGSSAFLPRRLPASPDSSSRFLPGVPGFFVPALPRKLLVRRGPLAALQGRPAPPHSELQQLSRVLSSSRRHPEIALSNSSFPSSPQQKNPSSPASAVSACRLPVPGLFPGLCSWSGFASSLPFSVHFIPELWCLLNLHLSDGRLGLTLAGPLPASGRCWLNPVRARGAPEWSV